MTEITKWNLEAELKKMAVSCIGLSESTAKKKAAIIFKKYSGIMAYSEYELDRMSQSIDDNNKLIRCLNSGKVSYKKGDSFGSLLIKDIEQVEIRKNDVLLITKTGREIVMGSDFKYLENLF